MNTFRTGIVAIVLSVPTAVNAVGFSSASLRENDRRLSIVYEDGTVVEAPRTDAPTDGDPQETFASPKVSSDRQQVGWLALYPNQGSTYPQPLYLVVMDVSQRIRRFRSSVGFVYAWCFVKTSDAVVFRSAFPHGPRSDRFEMRRLTDGKLLRQWKSSATGRISDSGGVAESSAPTWTRCALDDRG